MQDLANNIALSHCHMPLVEKSALVPHTATEMFALVDAVEKYPEFLPWCGATQLHSRDDKITVATIEINYHGIRQSFTTENSKQPAASMHITLREGPFKELDGLWQFTALGASGCKVALRMDYSFANSVLEAAVGPVFGLIASTMIERFVMRADAIYGSA
ncbi:MAG: type II toxin-antitoxin system RatA family toxin [Betaproteobacteria bacterium]